MKFKGTGLHRNVESSFLGKENNCKSAHIQVCCICSEKGTEIFTVGAEKPDVLAKEFKDMPKNAYFYKAVMWVNIPPSWSRVSGG